MEESQSDQQQISKRKPSILYCMYNETHSAPTGEEMQEHVKTCPDRSAYEHKWSKSQQVYQKFKTQLKTNARGRKGQMEELFGHHNGPTAQEMPTLHYKYRMNEPFVNGERGQYQVSHEQDTFKKRVVYGLDEEGKPQDDKQIKTTQDEIDDLKSEWNQDLLNTFQGKSAPDIHTLIVKQD